MPVRRHSARRLAALLSALVVAAGADLVPGVPAPAEATPGSAPRTTPARVVLGPAPLSTPLLSLRRVPELVATAVGTAKLDASLNAILSDPRFGGAANACLVVAAGTLPIYVHNPALPLLPASNLKLLTATAALDRLPPTSRLVTTVSADRPPTGGTISGNLYLVGGGDPLLRTPDYVANLRYPAQIYDNLTTLADQVRAAGVTQVTGSVVGDESRYDTQRAVPTWPARYAITGEVGPLSALSVNDGFAAFRPAAVSAGQPAQQAAAMFASLLRARGVTVSGTALAGTAPRGAATITDMASAPVADLVAEILRRSDNNGAELITKELGRRASPPSPTTTAGVAVIQGALQADGLPTEGLHMVDGSGLDRSDRVTCQLILASLLRGGPNGALGRGLAVAGKSGTLFRRMIGTPAAGRLGAKTGSLEGVSALSGFVSPASGSDASTTGSSGTGLAFSLITNSAPSLSAGDALGDRVGVLLAQFPQAPPVAQLAPR